MGEYTYLSFPASAVTVDEQQLARLPTSAQRVFAAIVAQGPLDHRGVAACTGMPARTIRFALRRLREEGMVDSRCSLRDSRVAYYFVDPRLVSPEAVARSRQAAGEARATGATVLPAI